MCIFCAFQYFHTLGVCPTSFVDLNVYNIYADSILQIVYVKIKILNRVSKLSALFCVGLSHKILIKSSVSMDGFLRRRHTRYFIQTFVFNYLKIHRNSDFPKFSF